jgi:hypothetical protein
MAIYSYEGYKEAKLQKGIKTKVLC